MKPRYHYTRACYLESIISDRCIKPATAYLQQREKPGVWCSTHEDFEPTARPALVDAAGAYRGVFPFEEMVKRPDANPVRIEVVPTACPHAWGAFVKLSGIKLGMARALARAAKKQGARPEDWYVSFEPIPADKWVHIAYYLDGQWLTFEPDPTTFELLSLNPLGLPELLRSGAT